MSHNNNTTFYFFFYFRLSILGSRRRISDLPHQFKSVHEFESKIVQPIGRTWNPEHKFKKLTQPKLITRLGSVIEPIDRDDLNAKNIKKKS